MGTFRLSFVLVLLGIAVAGGAQTPDITGKWTASFDTQIGVQTYTYEFVVKDSTLTGSAKSNIGEAKIQDGRVQEDIVTFVEMLTFEGMEIRIDYKGQIVSADEIKFTRQVGDFATEELVAHRAKQGSDVTCDASGVARVAVDGYYTNGAASPSPPRDRPRWP